MSTLPLTGAARLLPACPFNRNTEVAARLFAIAWIAEGAAATRLCSRRCDDSGSEPKEKSGKSGNDGLAHNVSPSFFLPSRKLTARSARPFSTTEPTGSQHVAVLP